MENLDAPSMRRCTDLQPIDLSAYAYVEVFLSNEGRNYGFGFCVLVTVYEKRCLELETARSSGVVLVYVYKDPGLFVPN